MKFSVYQRSEQGGRKQNEDRMGYTYTRSAALFVVADGMGGHAHGELAAQIALETFTEYFKQQAHPSLVDPREFLSKALLLAHHQILRFSNEHGMADSPRTTLVALVIQNGEANWVHCGDSRLYWLRDMQLVKRTVDHSYVEQKPQGANVTAEMLARIANRNVLFTCLGSPTKPIFEVSPSVALDHGDKFLLCSDGLWSTIREQEMVEVMCASQVVQSVPSLIDMALHNGGRHSDNVTAIGLEWEGIKLKKSPQNEVVTDTLGHEVFASTVQNHLVDIDHLEAKDLDIERSLKEINEAIQKSLPKK